MPAVGQGRKKAVVTLANGLNDEGHDVEVWARKNSVLCDELAPTIKVRIVPFLNDFEPFTLRRLSARSQMMQVF